MIWLSTSLFCSKSQWNTLFAEGIIPFLKDKITRRFLNDYTIEFNYLDGENIRFSLLTEEKNADELIKHTDDYFKDYFLKLNQLTPEIDVHVEKAISVHSNTIQWGLYPQRAITQSEKEDYSLSIDLSQIVLKELTSDVIDDDTILTFAFYLQLGLIKCINEIYPEQEDVLKAIYKNLVYDTRIMDRNIIRIKFVESKEMLQEIKQDILEDESHRNSPQWLEAWMSSCKKEINKYKRSQPEDVRAIYRKIVYLTIHNHLAITPPMSLLLSYFIENILF